MVGRMNRKVDDMIRELMFSLPYTHEGYSVVALASLRILQKAMVAFAFVHKVWALCG